MPPRAHLQDRLWEKASIPADVLTGCWEWRAAKSRVGYGVIRELGRSFYAHRCAWEAMNGPIPPGLEICHTCDNRGCVNPAHLFVGTRADNMADASQKDRTCFGVSRRNAKLNDDKVREIRVLVGAGLSKAEAARQFGVSLSTLIRVVDRRSWRRVN